MIYMFLSNNPSLGDINSSNLPCFYLDKALKLKHSACFVKKMHLKLLSAASSC